MKKFILTIVLIATIFSRNGISADPDLTLKVSAPKTPLIAGDDITLTVSLSTISDAGCEFHLGALAQDFGIYILGPRGVIAPNPEKVLPDNWMHHEHSAAAKIRVTPDQPYRATINLSEYFKTSEFKVGRYQINLKFHDLELKMDNPLDSNVLKFDLIDKAFAGIVPPRLEPASFLKLDVKGRLVSAENGQHVIQATTPTSETAIPVRLARTEDKNRELDVQIARLTGKTVRAIGYFGVDRTAENLNITLLAFGDFQIQEVENESQNPEEVKK